LFDQDGTVRDIVESHVMERNKITQKKNGLASIKKTDYIYCDSAEPNRLEELRRNGFNAYPADKSVKDGIDFVKRCKIYSKDDNVNINKEVLSYCYKQDKDGNILEEPVKFNYHLMDSIRYAVYTHSKRYAAVHIRWL